MALMASQGTHPACLFLALTLLVTTAATMILCSAILTNHWEVITFDKGEVEAIAAKHNASHTLSWLWGGKVGMVSGTAAARPPALGPRAGPSCFTLLLLLSSSFSSA